MTTNNVQLIDALQKLDLLQRHIIDTNSKIIQTLKDGDLKRLEGVKAPAEMTQPSRGPRRVEEFLDLLTEMHYRCSNDIDRGSIEEIHVDKDLWHELQIHFSRDCALGPYLRNYEGEIRTVYRGIKIVEAQR